MKNFILGGGISGLLAAYYNPSFTIITKDVGGKLLTSSAPIIHLDVHLETEKLLQELGFSTDKRDIKLGYVVDNFICGNISTAIKQKIIIKKMTDCHDLYEDLPLNTLEVSLGTGSDVIQAYTVDHKAIIKVIEGKLRAEGRIVFGDIVELDDNYVMCQNGTFAYDKLISTMPANIFYRIYNGRYKLSPDFFRGIGTTMVIADRFPDSTYDSYDQVYNSDYKTKYNRIMKSNGNYYYEFTGRITPEEIKQLMPKNVSIIDFSIQPLTRVISNSVADYEKIKFLGRFAEWNHRIKTEHVLEKVKRIIVPWANGNQKKVGDFHE